MVDDVSGLGSGRPFDPEVDYLTVMVGDFAIIVGPTVIGVSQRGSSDQPRMSDVLRVFAVEVAKLRARINDLEAAKSAQPRGN